MQAWLQNTMFENYGQKIDFRPIFLFLSEILQLTKIRILGKILILAQKFDFWKILFTSLFSLFHLSFTCFL